MIDMRCCKHRNIFLLHIVSGFLMQRFYVYSGKFAVLRAGFGMQVFVCTYVKWRRNPHGGID